MAVGLTFQIEECAHDPASDTQSYQGKETRESGFIIA